MTSQGITIALIAVPVYLASNLIHELGHAVMGRLCGCEVTSFGLGIGRVYWLSKWRGTSIYLGWSKPLQGLAWICFPQIYPSRWVQAGVYSGGVLAQSAVGLSALFAYFLVSGGNDVLLLVAVINLLGLFNLLPFSFSIGTVRFYSDGAVLLHHALRGVDASTAPYFIQSVRAFDAFWQEIADLRALHINLVVGASSWLELGNAEQAQIFLDRADMLPIDDPFRLAFAAVIRGFVTCEADKPESATAALNQAEQGFAALNHENGLLLVSLGKALQTMKSGDPILAVAALTSLQHLPFVQNRFSLRVMVLAFLLRVQARLSAADEVERLLAEYETLRRSNSWPFVNDLDIYRTLAVFHRQRGEMPRAETAYRKSLVAAKAIFSAFATKEDREHFRACQEPWLTEIGAALRQQGFLKGAEEIAAIFSSADKLEVQLASAALRRNQSRQRTGLLLTAANIAVFAGIMIAIWPLLKRPASDNPFWLFPLVIHCVFLVLFSIGAGINCAIMYPLWWMHPETRDKGGIVTLFFAMIPWIIFPISSLILLVLWRLQQM